MSIAQEGQEVVQHEYPIPLISKDLIVDTNGAGDSFVGGFVSQIVQSEGRDLDKAIRAGMWLSG